jgi:hypothetical protein
MCLIVIHSLRAPSCRTAQLEEFRRLEVGRAQEQRDRVAELRARIDELTTRQRET